MSVTWQQAMNYAAARGGSLPTEAQWEFAARGAAGRTYPWGEAAPTCVLAQYDACDPRATLPVMSRPGGATPDGIYDLAGNVWEWIADRSGSYSSADATDPTGPESGSSRVSRGGSFHDPHPYLRGSFRNSDAPGAEYDANGIRLVWAGREGRD